jgi:hypothetical protein
MRLEGIDGTHLLGFMAGIGTLALLDAHARSGGGASPRLSFAADGSARVESAMESREQVVSALIERLRVIKPFYDRELADQKTPSDFTATSFAELARRVDRTGADILAGLACHVGEDLDSATESSLCAANGASHQCLILSMRDVLALVDTEHLDSALFALWSRSYEVPGAARKKLGLGQRNPTLRLDPADERPYALRLTNPTTTKDFTTELGAQALAIPAFSLLPVLPRARPLTVSSRRSSRRVTFSWCLWEVPATLATVRSLIYAGPKDATALRARGVFSAFCVDRVAGAKGKLSFSPAVGLW